MSPQAVLFSPTDDSEIGAVYFLSHSFSNNPFKTPVLATAIERQNCDYWSMSFLDHLPVSVLQLISALGYGGR